MLRDDKSNTLDSGRIFVQQADSWGKTVVLRDGIDTESIGRGMGALSVFCRRRNRLGQRIRRRKNVRLSRAGPNRKVRC